MQDLKINSSTIDLYHLDGENNIREKRLVYRNKRYINKDRNKYPFHQTNYTDEELKLLRIGFSKEEAIQYQIDYYEGRKEKIFEELMENEQKLDEVKQVLKGLK